MLLNLARCSAMARREGKRESRSASVTGVCLASLASSQVTAAWSSTPTRPPRHLWLPHTSYLKTSLSSQLHSQLGGLSCSLLDLGLGGIDRDAQRAHKVNKAIENLEHCLGRASHCEVIFLCMCLFLCTQTRSASRSASSRADHSGVNPN
jgi:hypothetical protein